MTLLPGQVIAGGVSNFLFGVNNPDFNQAFQTGPTSLAIQAQLAANGISVVRCAVEINGTHCTDAQLDAMATACSNAGAKMLCILLYNSLTFNEHVVTHLGSRCNLYEHSNEPDISGITYTQYLTDWNAVVPACKAINTNCAFIGPALGVASNYSTYLIPWLTGCISSGNIPDGISFHDYPCTSLSTIPQAVCYASAPNIAVDAQTIGAAVTATLGRPLPLCITEWNVDAFYGNSNAQTYSPNTEANGPFLQSWVTAAMDGMIAAGVAMACLYELNYYLINATTPSAFEPEMLAFLGAIAATIGVNAEISLDNIGYFVKPGSYHMKQPRIAKGTIRADNGVSYVDFGPGKREWAMIVLCKNDLLNYDGTPAAYNGQEFRDALKAVYTINPGSIVFVDPLGTSVNVYFDDYVEAVLDLRSQQVQIATGGAIGASYEVAIVLVEV